MESKGSLGMVGSSLKVPIVQELAKDQNLRTVPSRYVRPDHHHDLTLTASDVSSSPQIPVIDMLKLLDPDSMESEVRRLHEACQEWGFFQLINHGVDVDQVEKMKTGMQEFFDLPIEEKERFRQLPDELEGYGQVFVVSEEQKLDWADLLFMVTSPASLRKPHLIPMLPAPFKDAIDAYGAEVKNLAMKILNFMAKGLGMESEDMGSLFDEGMQSMRMNYYPPCPQPELVTGLCPHSDAVGLTILLQVNEMEGLQVKKDATWIPVSPLPNAFIVNVGDILEIVTNGAYRSVEHRATVNSEKERLSIATFLSAAIDGDIAPAPSLVSLETPAKFMTVSMVEYLKGLFSKELKGKSYVDLMRIQN